MYRFGQTTGITLVLLTALTYGFDRKLRNEFENASAGSFILGLVLNVAGLAVGYSMSMLMKMPVEYHRTLAFEVGCQNLAVPIAVISLLSDNVLYMKILYYAILGIH